MLLSYAALAESVALLFMAGIALSMDSRSRLNQAYSLLAAASALWAFAYTGVYAAQEEGRIWLWYRISAIGWCSTIPATLFLTLTFTNRRERPVSRVLFAVTLAYSATLLAVQLHGSLFVQGFAHTPFGNAEIVDLRKPGYALMLGPMLAATLWTIATYARSIPKQPSRRRRRLSALMLACVAVTVPVGIVANLVLSFFLRRPFPSLGIFALIFLLGGALPIIARFRSLSASDLSRYVADAIEDRVVILVRDDIARRRGREAPQALRDCFSDPGEALAALSEAVTRKVSVELLADVIEDGRERRAVVRITPVFEGEENGGCIVVIKANRDFSERAEEFGLSTQERELVARILEGLSTKETADRMGLSPGTVRNYTSNVFKKTGARGRSDLIRLFVPGL
jgi:DNA-binding CsgD family transcriptional regulator